MSTQIANTRPRPDKVLTSIADYVAGFPVNSQEAYNTAHGITPQTIQKEIAAPWAQAAEADYVDLPSIAEEPTQVLRISAEVLRRLM